MAGRQEGFDFFLLRGIEFFIGFGNERLQFFWNLDLRFVSLRGFCRRRFRRVGRGSELLTLFGLLLDFGLACRVTVMDQQCLSLLFDFGAQ